MNQEINSNLQTVRFVCPLNIKTPDGEVSRLLDNPEYYKDAIKQAVAESLLPEDPILGWRSHYDFPEELENKVVSCLPTIGEIEGRLLGAVECTIYGKLGEEDLVTFTEFLTEKLAGGWGKEFAETPIEIDGGTVRVIFCDNDPVLWDIMPETDYIAALEAFGMPFDEYNQQEAEQGQTM